MKALEVAKYVVKLCLGHGRPVSNLQLQKILYLAHVFYIMKTGEGLIEDSFEAWRLGPVIPDVYEEYSIYAGAPIIFCEEDEDMDIDPNKIEVVRNLIANLSAEKPWRLVELTHKKGGAWDKTYMDGRGNRNVINPRLIYMEAGR